MKAGRGQQPRSEAPEASRLPGRRGAVAKRTARALRRALMRCILVIPVAAGAMNVAQSTQLPGTNGAGATFYAQGGDNLQAWVNTISAQGGGTLIVPEGTYPAAVVLASNITISCVSPKAYLSLPASANADVVTIPKGASNISIVNCSISGNASNQTGTSRGIYAAGRNSAITLDDVSVDDSHDDAVYFGYASVTVVNGLATGGTYNTNISITNSSLTNCGTQCIHIADTRNLWITGNYMYNWGARLPANDAIGAVGFNSNVHITQNVGITLSSTYFFMESASSYFQRVVAGGDISNNFIITESSAAGAALGFSGLFFDTTFANNIHLGLSVGANSCSHRAGYEIVGDDDSILNNTILNGAIVFAGGDRFTIAKNNIANACSAGEYGLIAVASVSVGADTMTRGIVDGNSIAFTASPANGSAIVLGVYGTSGPFAGVDVVNNSITCPGTNATVRGISLRDIGGFGSGNSSVRGNRVSCPGVAGVYLGEATLQNSEITGNDLRGSGPSAVQVVPGGTNVRVWNNIMDH